jgi:hypothetical protein
MGPPRAPQRSAGRSWGSRSAVGHGSMCHGPSIGQREPAAWSASEGPSALLLARLDDAATPHCAGNRDDTASATADRSDLLRFGWSWRGAFALAGLTRPRQAGYSLFGLVRLTGGRPTSEAREVAYDQPRRSIGRGAQRPGDPADPLLAALRAPDEAVLSRKLPVAGGRPCPFEDPESSWRRGEVSPPGARRSYSTEALDIARTPSIASGGAVVDRRPDASARLTGCPRGSGGESIAEGGEDRPRVAVDDR